MKKFIALILLCAFILSGCSNSPKLENYKEDPVVVNNQSKGESLAYDITNARICKNGTNGFTIILNVVNTTENIVEDFNVDLYLLDTNGNKLTSESHTCTMVAPGETAIISAYFSFREVDPEKVADFDGQIKVTKSSDQLRLIDYVRSEYTINDRNVVVSVTNDSNAKMVIYTNALLTNGNDVVDICTWPMFLDPGETSVESYNTEKEFDNVEFYVNPQSAYIP